MRSNFGSALSGARLAALLIVAPAALAQQSPIYGERDLVHPVYGKSGMVATQEAEASRIGLEVLQNGGNAVDAAATVAFALAVTLPSAGNLGGGGFMLVHDAEKGETVAIDYREKAGGRASRDIFLDEAGEADPEKSRYSGLAVGVPGTVAGMALALERYGTISLAEALEPAIELAGQGYHGERGSGRIRSKVLQDRLQKWPSSTAVFYKDGGVPYRAGRDPGAGRSRSVAQADRGAGAGGILRRADRREDRRRGRERRRPPHHRRFPELRGKWCASRCAATTEASRSSRCRRRAPAACTSCRS